MKNFIQDGNVLSLTAPAAVASGDTVKVGNFIGVAAAAAANGATFQLAVEGVYSVKVATADDVAQGDKLYWDVADAEFNKTATANTFGGYAVTAAGVGVITVNIKLAGAAT